MEVSQEHKYLCETEVGLLSHSGSESLHSPWIALIPGTTHHFTHHPQWLHVIYMGSRHTLSTWSPCTIQQRH